MKSRFRPVLTLENFHHTRNCIQLNATTVTRSALEELAVHRRAKGLVSDLGKFFDDVSDYLDAKLAGFSDRKLVIKPTKIEKVLADHIYSQNVMLKVPVLPGMRVDWPTMVDLLEKEQEAVGGIYDTTLHPFSQFIGRVLNQPEKLTEASLRPNIKIRSTEDLQRKLAAALSNGNIDNRLFGQVFKRNADLIETGRRLAALVERHKKTPPELIAETVTALDANLEDLMGKIQDPNSAYRMTPQRVKELADICYVLAQEVTAYSAYTVLLEQAVNAINLTNDTVIKHRG